MKTYISQIHLTGTWVRGIMIMHLGKREKNPSSGAGGLRSLARSCLRTQGENCDIKYKCDYKCKYKYKMALPGTQLPEDSL